MTSGPRPAADAAGGYRFLLAVSWVASPVRFTSFPNPSIVLQPAMEPIIPITINAAKIL
jgi:hypothetical protein